MLIVRQNTARTILIGPVLDASGVAVTDCVVGDFKISRNGSAPAALDTGATLTHRHTGHYSLALTANDLDTVGIAVVSLDDGANACAPAVLIVTEELIYDTLFADGASGYQVPIWSSPSSAVNLSGTTVKAVTDGVGLADGAITANKLATDAITSAKIADGAITASKLASDAITSAKIADGALTAAKFASGAFDAVWSVGTRTLTSFGSLATDVATAVWSAGTRTLTGFGTLVADVWHHLTSSITASGSIGKQIKDNLDAAVSTRLASSAYTAPDNATISDIYARVNSLPSVVTMRKNSNAKIVAYMHDASGMPVTGASVSCHRSIDGGALTPISGSVSEIGMGLYLADLQPADTNGSTVSYLFTAPGQAIPFVVFSMPQSP